MLTNRHRARTHAFIGFAIVVSTALSSCRGDDSVAVTSIPAMTPPPASAVPTSVALTTTTAPPQEGSLHLVGLGDSIIGAGGSGADSILGRLAASMTSVSGRQVVVTNLGDGSNTSDGLVELLRHAEDHREAVAAADVVVVIVGGNDGDPFSSYPPGTCAPEQPPRECLAAYAPSLAANLDAILTEIEALRAGHPTAIRVGSPDYNPFVGWSEAPSPSFGTDFYAQVAAAETAAACEAASAHGALCIDVFHAFNGPNGTDDAAQFLASDHAHPGDAGVQRIVHEISRLGFSELGI